MGSKRNVKRSYPCYECKKRFDTKMERIIHNMRKHMGGSAFEKIPQTWKAPEK